MTEASLPRTKGLTKFTKGQTIPYTINTEHRLGNQLLSYCYWCLRARKDNQLLKLNFPIISDGPFRTKYDFESDKIKTYEHREPSVEEINSFIKELPEPKDLVYSTNPIITDWNTKVYVKNDITPLFHKNNYHKQDLTVIHIRTDDIDSELGRMAPTMTYIPYEFYETLELPDYPITIISSPQSKEHIQYINKINEILSNKGYKVSVDAPLNTSKKHEYLVKHLTLLAKAKTIVGSLSTFWYIPAYIFEADVILPNYYMRLQGSSKAHWFGYETPKCTISGPRFRKLTLPPENL